MRIGWKTTVTVVAAFAIGGIGGVTVAKTAKPEYTLVAAGSSKFAPVDPKNPAGIQMAVLSGDPKTGPTAFLLKLPKGAAPIHWHTANYWAVTVEGQTKHWLPGKEKDAKASGPGTAWYQPGGSDATAHGDECMSDSCTVFVYMDKQFDFTPMPAPKK